MAQTLPAAIARNILYCHTRTLSSSRNQLPPCFRYRTPSRPAFSTTAPVLKKGKKPSSLSDDNVDAAVNPLDFSALQAAISRTIDQLKRQITETRKGPRDVAAIEGLRVSLVKNSKETVELGQLAQVVSRGRILAVMVGDREHVDPIRSALNNSPHSLTPTTSPENPLELHIPLPPPTRESHSAIADAVTRHGEAAGLAISNARLAHKRKLRRLELSQSVRPDVFYKAGSEMEKVVGAGTAELKQLMDGAWKKI